MENSNGKANKDKRRGDKVIVFSAKHLNIFTKAGFTIFTDFSFDVHPGEVWCLEGPNGIGKSSFYEALIGLHSLSGGQIFLNGTCLNDLRPAERVRIGLKYVSQNNALFFHATVLENLMICAESLLPRSLRTQAIQKAIELFFLQDLLHKKAGELSGGQKRRVELSKIVIGEADLIMMDEPFAAIDENTIQKISKVILLLKHERKSFLVTDHHIEEARGISDYLISLGGEQAKIEKLK